MAEREEEAKTEGAAASAPDNSTASAMEAAAATTAPASVSSVGTPRLPTAIKTGSMAEIFVNGRWSTGIFIGPQNAARGKVKVSVANAVHEVMESQIRPMGTGLASAATPAQAAKPQLFTPQRMATPSFPFQRKEELFKQGDEVEVLNNGTWVPGAFLNSVGQEAAIGVAGKLLQVKMSDVRKKGTGEEQQVTSVKAANATSGKPGSGTKPKMCKLFELG